MDELLRELKNPWAFFGFGAQALFFMRFLVQWIASEREGRSVIPVAFWWFSIAGAGGLLVYAVQIRNPVFILGQSFGFLIYSRNLWLIYRERTAASAATAAVPHTRPITAQSRHTERDATVDAGQP
jgi:lipid-A-disaccharide synthase-like uncharacterized protein